MRFFRWRLPRPEPDPRTGWHVLGDHRHYVSIDALGRIGPICGARMPANAADPAGTKVSDWPECDGCWEHIEFLRWA
jgi:hypothetical protein